MRSVIVAVVYSVLQVVPVAAQTGPEIGARVYQHWALDGTRVGDMQGRGGFVLAPWHDVWQVGGGLDYLFYDLETPIDATGLVTADPKPVDAFVEIFRVRADLRRRFRVGSRFEPYLEGGVAIYFPRTDDVTGRLADGRTYSATIATPVTQGVNVSGGFNIRIVDRLLLNLAVSYGQALRGYDVSESVSGRTGTIRAVSPLGPSLALAYRF